MKVSLRQSTEADRDFVWHLRATAMRPYVEQTWGWDPEWQEQEFNRNFDPLPNHVIELGGEPVGYLSVQHHQDHVFIELIEIAPEYQRQGIATSLIKQIIRDAEVERLPVRLQVLKVNPARLLYERLGFRLDGETETHHHMVREPGRST